MSTGYNAINFKNKDIDRFANNFSEKKDKDYSGRRNVFGQTKDKVTTREKSTDRSGKVTEKTITTKTRSISPNRTAVYNGLDVTKRSKKGYNPVLRPGGQITQQGKAKTVRTARLDKFLEKNPEYKVIDGTLKTKVKTDTKTYSDPKLKLKKGQTFVSKAPQIFERTSRTSKKGKVAEAREYQAKSLPRKIIQSLPVAGFAIPLKKNGYYKEK
jgi:hypothetical protein